MIVEAKKHLIASIEMREAYSNALINAAINDDRIFTIDCDLRVSMGTKAFAEKFPNRSINCGIQESNACGVAAGLSAVGFVPFLHSFAVFSSRRIYDQAFVSCAYAGLNVKLIGGDAGVSTATNGGTHMAFEDVGIMRNIPGITIVEPSDPVMMMNIIPQVATMYGVVYLRMPRKDVITIYDEASKFHLGKAAIIREGTDVTIIALGILVGEALKAADKLAAEGISARVVDMFTVKPIDKHTVIESAKKTGAIVTAENHSVINGLGSAVAEVIVENILVPLERVGVKDEFGEVGSQEYLMNRFGLTAQFIYEKAKRAMSKKEI